MKKIKIKLPWFFETEIEREVSIVDKDQKIAWQLYCDLITRVGVVEFREDEDIILYCLDSWYNFFKTAKDGLKQLEFPIGSQNKINKTKNKIIRKKTYLLSQIIIRLLNEELRPILRKWHPYIKHHMENKVDKTRYVVEEQRNIPKWTELISEITELHLILKSTSKALFDIAIH